jgi:hypothetical protein
MLVKVVTCDGRVEVLGIGNVELVSSYERGATSVVHLTSGKSTEILGTPEEFYEACLVAAKELAVVSGMAATEAAMTVSLELKKRLDDA